MRIVLVFFALLALIPLGLGCSKRGTAVHDRTVRVGCGMCRFKLTTDRGCYWAAEIDGRVVPVGGSALPENHENHAPGGMCNVTRDAIVSGTLYEDRLSVTKFELKPVAPAENPAFSPGDEH